MNAKGNKFFRAMSILMVIGGTGGIIAGVIEVIGASDLAAAIGDTANFGLLMLASVLVWAGGVAGLIAGIAGMKNTASPDKLMTCVVFGILTVALSALGRILAVTGGGSLNVRNLFISLSLPGLYLVGAVLSQRKHSQ